MADAIEMLQAFLLAAHGAMVEEGIGTATRQRVMNRLQYGNPGGPGWQVPDDEDEDEAPHYDPGGAVIRVGADPAGEARESWAQAGLDGGHAWPPSPGKGQPWFGADGREVQPWADGAAGPYPADWYPVTSQCRCSRQVTLMSPQGSWEHSD